MSVKILIGDVLEQLATLDNESVDCVVTSPPYWGLRDYGVVGQIGLEPTLSEHIDVMVRVFEEIKRVLKPTGTVWVNYGDCYAANVNGRSAADTKALSDDDRTFRDKPFSTVGPIYDPSGGASGGGFRGSYKRGETGDEPKGRVVAGGFLKPKDLCMVPNRLAIALQEAGWWVRSEIIWAKPNPMPESINDRPATSHEKIFLLSKSARYFYDADAVRVPSSWDAKNTKFPDGWDTGEGAHGSSHRNGREKGKKVRISTPRHEGHIQHTKLDVTPTGHGRNLRNWEPEPLQAWKIATRSFKGAHFATFPPELAERCIKAGCPSDGIVLDPFGGAGTTGLVADQLGRDSILIELNPEYVDIANNRLKASLVAVEGGPTENDTGELPLFNQPNNQSAPDLDQPKFTDPRVGQGCSGLPDGEAA